MLDRAYVAGMRAVRRWGERAGWLAAIERRRNSRAWRYARTLLAIHDVEDLARLDVPWWSFAAIDRIEAFLASHNGRARAFEYGPGASTFWLARRCAQVAFVEHDGAWWARFNPLAARLANARGRLVPPRPLAGSERPVCGSGRKHWRGFEFEAYVDSIAQAGGPFDLIVIDGRARSACLSRALPHLAPGGLMVFDNSNRARYRQALAACGLAVARYRGLTPAVPYPTETALLRRPDA